MQARQRNYKAILPKDARRRGLSYLGSGKRMDRFATKLATGTRHQEGTAPKLCTAAERARQRGREGERLAARGAVKLVAPTLQGSSACTSAQSCCPPVTFFYNASHTHPFLQCSPLPSRPWPTRNSPSPTHTYTLLTPLQASQ